MRKKRLSRSVFSTLRQPKNRISLLVLVIGVIAAIMVQLNDGETKQELLSGNEIRRNEYGEGSFEWELTATYGNEKERFKIAVEERQHTKEELESISEYFVSNIWELIKGENTSIEEVSDNLRLLNVYEGYPFRIYWNTSDESVIDKRGKIICPLTCESNHSINITGTIIFDDFKKEFSILVNIVPRKVPDNEKKRVQIEEIINQNSENSASEKYITLPNRIDDEEINWESYKGFNSLWVILVTIIVIPLLRLAYEYDQRKEKEKIRDLLENEYPQFVTKLKLFMSAGSNIKNSMIALQKEIASMKNHKKSYLIVEIDNVINMINNGVSQERAIEELGRRCQGLYRKLSFLLIVNLKRGNDRIIQLLEEESHVAYAIRKERALKKADEAAVKLLFPMMLLLLMIMIIIMIPAYFDFGGS